MDVQNRFYSKLYSKQTINLDGEDTKIFFENSNILRLSDELSASCEGKITLQECENIKSLLIPKMLYVFSILPSSEDFIKQLNSIIYNFLWKGPDKIARLATINDLKHGRLDLIDIETSIKASRLPWIGRLFSEGSLTATCPLKWK